ncbi:hypothetical protein [Roseobacter sp. MH60115]|uniref:hypothetical protein n=1 Tax=Roseobacter sp. MH60115 TaxID=2785324 RepID=UPI0018A2B563|nr:hypothetical protein [Roseobacter sp. MH60115]
MKLSDLAFAVPVLIDALDDDDAYDLIDELIADGTLPAGTELKTRRRERENQKVNLKSLKNLKRGAAHGTA